VQNKEAEVALEGAATAASDMKGAAKGAGHPGTVGDGKVTKTKHGTRAGHAGVERLQWAGVPVGQLLVELAALLLSYEGLGLAGCGALLCVVSVATCLAPEQLLAFYEDAGALLLQVLWLHEQLEHTGPQNAEELSEPVFKQVLPAFSGGLCLELSGCDPQSTADSHENHALFHDVVRLTRLAALSLADYLHSSVSDYLHKVEVFG
jgi:hypothetical protein